MSNQFQWDYRRVGDADANDVDKLIRKIEIFGKDSDYRFNVYHLTEGVVLDLVHLHNRDRKQWSYKTIRHPVFKDPTDEMDAFCIFPDADFTDDQDRWDNSLMRIDLGMQPGRLSEVKRQLSDLVMDHNNTCMVEEQSEEPGSSEGAEWIVVADEAKGNYGIELVEGSIPVVLLGVLSEEDCDTLVTANNSEDLIWEYHHVPSPDGVHKVTKKASGSKFPIVLQTNDGSKVMWENVVRVHNMGIAKPEKRGLGKPEIRVMDIDNREDEFGKGGFADGTKIGRLQALGDVAKMINLEYTPPPHANTDEVIEDITAGIQGRINVLMEDPTRRIRVNELASFIRMMDGRVEPKVLQYPTDHTVADLRQQMSDLLADLQAEKEVSSNVNLVVRDWIGKCSFKQQAVLLSALRGCDGLGKEDPSKPLVRWYRRVLLHPADTDANGLKQFMGDGSMPRMQMMKFVGDMDPYPMHWLLHFAHGMQIVGIYHPDTTIKGFAHDTYKAIVEAMHMNMETIEQNEERLKDNR